ncbi:MAG: hypothetical protein NT061_06815 [Spirochaetes bacterium]|nr:hypothetical protein [Spirochaetota bacterium]
MDNDKGKGTFKKWFGVKKSCCCDIKVEEIKDEKENDGKNEQDDKAIKPGDVKKKGRSCCG